MDLGQCSFEEVQAIADNIEGWIHPLEASLLYDIASILTGNGAIVEIGSWCSKSLTYLTAAALKTKNNSKVISIDPFLTSKYEPNGKYETFVQNLKNNEIYERIIHIKERSQIVGENFNEKIEFIFIDGLHKYEAVKKDLELFYPKIIEGGYIALHDVTHHEGPTKLAIELAQNDDTFRITNIVVGTLIAQKVQKLTPEDKIRNAEIIEIIDSSVKKANCALAK